jgi:hypothetical protein
MQNYKRMEITIFLIGITIMIGLATFVIIMVNP